METTTTNRTTTTATTEATGADPRRMTVTITDAQCAAVREGALRSGLTCADYARALMDAGLAAERVMREAIAGDDARDHRMPELPEKETVRRRRIASTVDAALRAFARKYHTSSGAPITYCGDKRLRSLGVAEDATGDEIGGHLASIARGDRAVDGVSIERLGDIPSGDSRPRVGYRVSMK